MNPDRRKFLKGAGAGVLGGAIAGATTAGAIATSAEAGTGIGQEPAPRVRFHGPHQAGILTPTPSSAAFAVFDIVGHSKTGLIELMRALTDQARFLTTGGTPPDLGPASPPADSGMIGPTINPNALTITVGVGASLFDGRFGLTGKKPKRLKPMTTFPNDNLNPAECHGDLLLQICSASTDTTFHALRTIAKHTRGAMQLRYRIDGFTAPPRPSGTPRNLLGFKDGIANPPVHEAATARRLLWAAPDEPAWAAGGTYHVMRIIRMFIEFWDRVSLTEQENMFGRRRDTGAPLDGSAETDIPAYAKDPKGAVIPLDSHIRRANPRTPQTDDSRILRRGYNYDRGIDTNGNLDAGLVFNCFQQDPMRQFEANQRRLVDEPLVDYISPTGGGYFFALPGIHDTTDWYARALLTGR
ncbi:iron uptake transporter deferrochelatase/peroxidase subunit [Actinoallomurus sp. NPDC050550]|uniref:iron uptake transporter deferrochelatase/peroxidase subunit n=1 Tax=Actinoallomurus sp. NPDC050550 TaxID=3154937 RepID=UPI0033CC7414